MLLFLTICFVPPSLSNFCQKIISFFWKGVDLPPSYLDDVFKYTGLFWRLPLRGIASLGASIEDLKIIDFLFIISHLEQSATVLHSSLTVENSNDLERVQKSAVKILLGNQYNGYENWLIEEDSVWILQRNVSRATKLNTCFQKMQREMMWKPEHLKNTW